MKKTSLRWFILIAVVIGMAGTGFGIFRYSQNNFEAHVVKCTYFPQMAGYWNTPVGPYDYIGLVERDSFAFSKFTEAYSNPVQVSVIDDPIQLLLRRVWKAGDGYLIMTTGLDVRNACEMDIRYTKDDPGLRGKSVDMTTVTREFLQQSQY